MGLVRLRWRYTEGATGDETRTLEPLERTACWEQGEVPETDPFTV